MVISKRAGSESLDLARLGVLAATTLVLLALPAYAETPAAQLRAGVAPDEIQCYGDLVLAVWAGGPACVREQTATRLGLELVERPLRAADAPSFSDAVAHEAQVAEIRPHVLVPVSEANIREPEKIPVPPPERRVPIEFLMSHKDNRSLTIMVDPDRTGYWPPLSKADTDELVERFAAILGETMDYTAVRSATDPNSNLEEVADDFDFSGDFYELYYFTEDAVFTTETGLYDVGPVDSPYRVAGPLQYVRHFSPLSSVDHMEFITRFMDEMNFDGWTVYDPYDKGPQLTQYRFEYYLFRGTHSDDLDTSILDRFHRLGPYKDLGFYLPEVESGQVSVDDVLANYEKYEARIKEHTESLPLPQKTEYDGFGAISFRFDGGSVVIEFSGWSNDPIPDPVISRKEAIERAIEFARTDEALSGPQCGLDIPDRSVEDKPRYIDLHQFGGTPFWNVLMGPCEKRHTIDELMNNSRFTKFLGDYRLDVINGHKTIKLDRNGDIDLTSIGLAPLDESDQYLLNHLHDIDIEIFVDALDGETIWSTESDFFIFNKLDYQTHLKDEDVWFLEGGEVVFAEDWPKGYLGETSLLMEVDS